MTSVEARWARGRRLVVTVPAMYESETIHEMSAVSAGCRCAKLLRAVREKEVGLLVDCRSGPFGECREGAYNARVVLGDEVVRWCPFCRGSLRMSAPRYVVRTGLP